MATFEVAVSVELSIPMILTVEADSEQEAMSKAEEQFEHGEIDFDDKFKDDVKLGSGTLINDYNVEGAM